MADDTEQEGKGFKVQDRRRFSGDTGEPSEPSEGQSPPPGADQATAQQPEASRAPESDEVPPTINFPTFIISLSTQVLMQLGEIPNPLTGQIEKEVKIAKQTIDIINLLRDKTRGNLDPEEDKLMEEILFELRMKYVEAVRNK